MTPARTGMDGRGLGGERAKGPRLGVDAAHGCNGAVGTGVRCGGVGRDNGDERGQHHEGSELHDEPTKVRK